jgi:hypothetical protein
MIVMSLHNISVTFCEHHLAVLFYLFIFFYVHGDHWGDPGIDGRIILRRIFGKWDVGVWSGLGWHRIGTGACECGNEPSGSIKCWEFFD